MNIYIVHKSRNLFFQFCQTVEVKTRYGEGNSEGKEDPRKVNSNYNLFSFFFDILLSSFKFIVCFNFQVETNC